MKRYKLVSECENGDWVFYECGRFGMLKHNEKYDIWEHSDGYICYGCDKDSKVYPLTMHNKIIADSIQHYYNEMHAKKLINGSYWVCWLDDVYQKIMELPDDSDEYNNYWKIIVDKIDELSKAKKHIDDIKSQYKI